MQYNHFPLSSRKQRQSSCLREGAAEWVEDDVPSTCFAYLNTSSDRSNAISMEEKLTRAEFTLLLVFQVPSSSERPNAKGEETIRANACSSPTHNKQLGVGQLKRRSRGDCCALSDCEKCRVSDTKENVFMATLVRTKTHKRSRISGCIISSLIVTLCLFIGTPYIEEPLLTPSSMLPPSYLRLFGASYCSMPSSLG